MRTLIFLALSGLACFSYGDNKAGTVSESSPFKKIDITLGKISLTVELADTPDLRARGLMNRSSLSDREGMLFVFADEMKLSFWMKNTLIPLSIGFFNKSGKLLQITDMEPASPLEINPQIYSSSKPAKYALEVPRGWFKRQSIKVGDIMKLPSQVGGK